MSETNSVSATVAVSPHGHEGGAAEGLTDVSGPLMLLTWMAFLILSLVLYKVAWKPILKALDQREDSIRTALDEADKARASLAQCQDESRRILREAEQRRAAILEEARTLSAQAAADSERRVHEQAAAVVAAARIEIESATESARTALRAEAADLVTSLASRLMGETLDASRDQALVREWVKQLPTDRIGGGTGRS